MILVSGFTTWLQEDAVGQTGAFLIGSAVAYLGVIFRDYTEAGRKRVEGVRGLVTPAAPVQRALRQAQARYDETARLDPQKVPDLFRADEDLIAADLVNALSSGLDRANALPQECLHQWRDALDLIRTAQKQHAVLRGLIGRPGSRAKIVERRHEYARELQSASDALAGAADATSRFAPKDARNSLTEISRKN